MSVIIPSQFNISEFNFKTEIKAPSGKVGIKQAYSSYGSQRSNLAIQTPFMWAPFGISINEDPVSGKIEKYTVQLSFDKDEDRAKQAEKQALFNAFKQIDEYAKKIAFEHSVVFFGKKKTKEQLEAIYHPIIQFSTDKSTGEVLTQYAPRFKAKIPFDKKENRIMGNVTEPNKETFDVIQNYSKTKGAHCRGVIHIVSLWIGTTGFGVSIKINPMEVKLKAGPSNHQFINLDNDEEQLQNKTTKFIDDDDDDESDTSSKPVKLQEQTFQNDSSDEDEDESEEELHVKKAQPKSRAKK